MLTLKLKIVLILGSLFVTIDGRSVKDFFDDRNQILAAEDSSYLGSDLTLTNEEVLANEVLMGYKINELDQAFINDDLPSSISFFQSRQRIEESNVYYFIHDMAKGGALHLHELAITSIDWVVSNITYRDNLYVCYKNETDSFYFGWYQSQPEEDTKGCPHWELVSILRETHGAENIDKLLKSRLSIVVDNPEVAHPNVNKVWSEFSKRFATLFSLVNYKEVLQDYFYQGLQEFYEDGVQYMEVRSVITQVCNNLDSDDCQPLSIIDSAKVYKEVADAFALDHPDDWCGLKMIYAPSRRVPADSIAKYFESAAALIEALPDFIIGFDLVGQEDLGEPLITFVNEILLGLENNPEMKVFFHAGETDWQGMATDFNIIDALLLNTTRMGHGYAIAKHPEAKRIAKERNIPIEVNPISNQVLGLVKDLRNHPVAPLIQEGFPIVVSSDDPGLWDAKGVSYDYYSVFMAMASKSMDLKLLKKLVENSLEYSTLEGEELQWCSQIVERRWSQQMQSYLPKIIRI